MAVGSDRSGARWTAHADLVLLRRCRRTAPDWSAYAGSVSAQGRSDRAQARAQRSIADVRMGAFLHPLTLTGPTGTRQHMDALVDTGAAFTTVPAPTLEALGVEPHRTMRFRLADGRLVDWRLG